MSEGKISPHEAQELDVCFRAHASELFGYACAITRGDQALAHDLVQAAFEAAARAWQALRGLAEEQRRGWLRRTLANIAVNGFRREAAFRDRLPRIEVLYRKIQVDPLEQAFSSIALERCWQVIRGLPRTAARGRAAALGAGHEGKRDRRGPRHGRENGERAPVSGPAQAAPTTWGGLSV